MVQSSVSVAEHYGCSITPVASSFLDAHSVAICWNITGLMPAPFPVKPFGDACMKSVHTYRYDDEHPSSLVLLRNASIGARVVFRWRADSQRPTMHTASNCHTNVLSSFDAHVFQLCGISCDGSLECVSILPSATAVAPPFSSLRYTYVAASTGITGGDAQPRPFFCALRASTFTQHLHARAAHVVWHGGRVGGGVVRCVGSASPQHRLSREHCTQRLTFPVPARNGCHCLWTRHVYHHRSDLGSDVLVRPLPSVPTNAGMI